MDRKLKQRKNEPLYKWCERIAETLGMTEEQTEALKEVSKRSYIDGVRTTTELNKQFRRY